jgi:hypothetical protein
MGIITEVGNAVKHFAVGDRVVVVSQQLKIRLQSDNSAAVYHLVRIVLLLRQRGVLAVRQLQPASPHFRGDDGLRPRRALWLHQALRGIRRRVRRRRSASPSFAELLSPRQAEYVRVPYADVGCFMVPRTLTDEQCLFLTDIFPTGWMAAENCNIKKGNCELVLASPHFSNFPQATRWLSGVRVPSASLPFAARC